MCGRETHTVVNNKRGREGRETNPALLIVCLSVVFLEQLPFLEGRPFLTGRGTDLVTVLALDYGGFSCWMTEDEK